MSTVSRENRGMFTYAGQNRQGCGGNKINKEHRNVKLIIKESWRSCMRVKGYSAVGESAARSRLFAHVFVIKSIKNHTRLYESRAVNYTRNAREIIEPDNKR